MRLCFTPLAEQDLESIADYMAADNRRRAITFVQELHQQCQHIALNPTGYRMRHELGRESRLLHSARPVLHLLRVQPLLEQASPVRRQRKLQYRFDLRRVDDAVADQGHALPRIPSRTVACKALTAVAG